MYKDMKILVAALLVSVSAMSFAEPPAEPNPIEESLNIVVGVAEGTIGVVAEVAEGTAKVIADLAGGAATAFERDILSMPGVFLGKNAMSSSGLTVGFTSINFYQQNMRGGVSTNDKRGRFSGSNTIEIAADFERLFGLEGIGFYAAADSLWSRSGGIDGASVGSSFGVNGNEGGSRALDVTQLWFEGAVLDGDLRIRAGKMDIAGGFECGGQTVAFDTGTYAGDNSTQFINGGLGGNAIIPFPDEGIGAAFFYNPGDTWYAAFGVVDAQADNRETGFNTAMTDEDYFFYIFETGITPQIESSKGPLSGAYRVGLWVDGQDKTRFSNDNNYRDDKGVYLSCDQMICKENDGAEDSQGLGAFFRWGYANSDLNEMGSFWSFGFSYQGLFDGRDDDLFGIGMAHGVYSDQAAAGFTENAETAYEVYYNATVNDNLSISPSLQYIVDPGGTNAASDALVLGVRAVVAF